MCLPEGPLTCHHTKEGEIISSGLGSFFFRLRLHIFTGVEGRLKIKNPPKRENYQPRNNQEKKKEFKEVKFLSKTTLFFTDCNHRNRC